MYALKCVSYMRVPYMPGKSFPLNFQFYVDTTFRVDTVSVSCLAMYLTHVTL